MFERTQLSSFGEIWENRCLHLHQYTAERDKTNSMQLAVLVSKRTLFREF
jgi:hypothetical protein